MCFICVYPAVLTPPFPNQNMRRMHRSWGGVASANQVATSLRTAIQLRWQSRTHCLAMKDSPASPLSTPSWTSYPPPFLQLSSPSSLLLGSRPNSTNSRHNPSCKATTPPTPSLASCWTPAAAPSPSRAFKPAMVSKLFELKPARFLSCMPAAQLRLRLRCSAACCQRRVSLAVFQRRHQGAREF